MNFAAFQQVSHVRPHPLQVMFVTQSFGLLLGTIVMVPKTAQTIASVVMLTFVLTGGYFVTSIPDWIGWLSEALTCTLSPLPSPSARM